MHRHCDPILKTPQLHWLLHTAGPLGPSSRTHFPAFSTQIDFHFFHPTQFPPGDEAVFLVLIATYPISGATQGEPDGKLS